MALDLTQQIREAINRARQILVVFPYRGETDSLTAALALAEILKKQNKQVEVASDSFEGHSSLNFLPGLKEIKSILSPLQKFIIKVDLAENQMESLSYEVKDDQLLIYVTPRQGLLNREDVRTASGDLKFDLIFAVGAPDWESLGKIYDNNTDLFFKTPTINLDCHPANEHFGKINLVDISAAAVSEIVFEFFSRLAPEWINEEVATLLLTGLIAKTKSFKSGAVNSRTLANAGKLVELGGRREEITQNLFRRRSLSSLKLWGLALTYLKTDAARPGLVWLTLSRDDFRKVGAVETDLPEIIDELLFNSPEVNVIVLLYETEKNSGGQMKRQIEGLVAGRQNFDVKLLTKPFRPEGTAERVKIIIPDKDLLAAEKAVVENIKNLVIKK